MSNMAAHHPSISIVVPAFDEAGCIAATLDEVVAFAERLGTVREIIVVDDGSTDATPELVEAARRKHASSSVAIILLRHKHNRGKGAAVRDGMIKATGDIVMFTDADLSAPLSEMPLLIDPVVAGDCDIVIGSRALDRSRITVRQGRIRETAGKFFNLIVRFMTGLNIHDTQCGFKAFRREAILPVLRVQRLTGFAFDVEQLYLASRIGLRIREVPVDWGHVPHTKVSLVRDSFRMFVDVFRIRLYAAKGGYSAINSSIAGDGKKQAISVAFPDEEDATKE